MGGGFALWGAPGAVVHQVTKQMMPVILPICAAETPDSVHIQQHRLCCQILCIKCMMQ